MEAEGSQPKRSKPTNLMALPQELITAILVRLPFKNILQCKSVSKDWLSLISSPLFAKTHLKCSANKDVRILLQCPLESKVRYCYVSPLFDENSTEAFDLENLDPSIIIAGSVNGLICLHTGLEEVILRNPLTRQVMHVPQLSHLDANSLLGYCIFMYGFGYDEVHDDYKIVAINHNGPAVVKIYSLKSDSWSDVDVFECWVQYDHSAKLVNGKVHCVTGSTFLTGGDDWGIMSIDLVDEKCGKVELPGYEQGDKELGLGVLGSDLSMLCNHIKDHKRTRIDVWVMKEYGVKESWTKLYSIKYSSRLDCYVTCPPLCMSNEGESLFVYESYVMIYNPEKKSIRYPKVINAKGAFRAALYIESLVSPILQNEQMTQH